MRRLLLALQAVVFVLCSCAQPEPDDTSPGARADVTPQTDTDPSRDAFVRDSEVSMDAMSPGTDASLPSRDAAVLNDAAADIGRPLPDASTEGGYCPEHLYNQTDGVEYPGFNCYFDNFEGRSPSNCDVAYPGASPCFTCMVERCCLQAVCGGFDIYERFEAVDGPSVFGAWSEFAMSIDRRREGRTFPAGRTYNGAIACVAHCIDTRRPEPPGLPGPALLVDCMQDCAEVFIPTCSHRPEWAEAWYEVNGAIRRNVEGLYTCLLTGPEDNATLGQPDDYPYPTYAYDSTQPRGTPYEPRFADTSCAEVCFGIAPPTQ